MKKRGDVLNPMSRTALAAGSAENGLIEIPPLALPLVEENLAPLAAWKPFEYGVDSAAEWFPRIYDLLHDLAGLAELFEFALRHEDWLNAYLLAAGMNQVAEDYLHPDPFHLGRAVKLLGKLNQPGGLFLAKSARTFAHAWTRVEAKMPQTRKIQAWQHRLEKVVLGLAERVLQPSRSADDINPDLVGECQALIAEVPSLPAALRGEILRLPSCFRSFDQQPEDMERIISDFAARWPDRAKKVGVIGIRTSGSYLAPLYAALLKSRGYQRVRLLTLRPGSPLTSNEQAALGELADGDGLALICDDPPNTGSTLLKTAVILKQAGLPPENIILLLQLFDHSPALPDALQEYPSVRLSWPDWKVNRWLADQEVKEVLSEACLPSCRITSLTQIPHFNDEENRRHAAALYRLKIQNNVTGKAQTCLVQVSGVGLGYFGEHALAVTQRLAGYSCRIIAYRNSLIFQEVPTPPMKPLNVAMLAENSAWIERLAGYILERSRRLPAHNATGLKLGGRNAVWEVASTMLSKFFGRGWWMARVPLVDPYVKGLLNPSHASVIDGDMALRNWFAAERGTPSLVKLNLAERDFSHLDLYSYDPVYDLASLAVEAGLENSNRDIRQAYELISGESIPAETWLVYQLVHLWDLQRQDEYNPLQYSRRMAQALQAYYEEVFFQDLEIQGSGPLCAIDIDGVLETSLTGFPSLTSKGAATLRALALHGYRTILATGRSLSEVIERCKAYHLAGGVAEYGAVIYDHLSGRAELLLDEADLENLFKLRSYLVEMEDIRLDPTYQYSVRGYQQAKNGKRRGLKPDEATRILREAGLFDRVYAISGNEQTDFMVRGIDKGSGLRAWISHATGDTRLAFAIGDSASDLPMLDLAEHAFAPANASPELVSAGIQVTRRPYQSGLEEAVGRLLSHRPGHCSSCRIPEFTAETAYLLEILAAPENGRSSMALQAGKLLFKAKERLHGS